MILPGSRPKAEKPEYVLPGISPTIKANRNHVGMRIEKARGETRIVTCLPDHSKHVNVENESLALADVFFVGIFNHEYNVEADGTIIGHLSILGARHYARAAKNGKNAKTHSNGKKASDAILRGLGLKDRKGVNPHAGGNTINSVSPIGRADEA